MTLHWSRGELEHSIRFPKLHWVHDVLAWLPALTNPSLFLKDSQLHDRSKVWFDSSHVIWISHSLCASGEEHQFCPLSHRHVLLPPTWQRSVNTPSCRRSAAARWLKNKAVTLTTLLDANNIAIKGTFSGIVECHRIWLMVLNFRMFCFHQTPENDLYWLHAAPFILGTISSGRQTITDRGNAGAPLCKQPSLLALIFRASCQQAGDKYRLSRGCSLGLRRPCLSSVTLL